MSGEGPVGGIEKDRKYQPFEPVPWEELIVNCSFSLFINKASFVICSPGPIQIIKMFFIPSFLLFSQWPNTIDIPLAKVA